MVPQVCHPKALAERANLRTEMQRVQLRGEVPAVTGLRRGAVRDASHSLRGRCRHSEKRSSPLARQLNDLHGRHQVDRQRLDSIGRQHQDRTRPGIRRAEDKGDHAPVVQLFDLKDDLNRPGNCGGSNL